MNRKFKLQANIEISYIEEVSPHMIGPVYPTVIMTFEGGRSMAISPEFLELAITPSDDESAKFLERLKQKFPKRMERSSEDYGAYAASDEDPGRAALFPIRGRKPQ